MKVRYGTLFKTYLKNFPVSDQLKIRHFISHIEQFGYRA
ncbi:Uncharacterised protein [Moraxella equi]|uniref:Uncharacterized protein n=1 Tax=Moraxella equi TaxID=60442 RepID=A0A378QUQ7_9GAMM|nr:Uncharacterised protein [Moraxella equi]